MNNMPLVFGLGL